MKKNVAAHVSAVCKGIFLIGFNIQIILGIVWMCCNFGRIPDFPESDATLYTALLGLLGGCAPVVYLVQLGAAFLVGYFLLQALCPARRLFALWRALVLVTFPFALQCHLALQPHSLFGTLLLTLLLCVTRAAGRCGGRFSEKEGRGSAKKLGGEGKKQLRQESGAWWWCGALLSLCLLILMSGVADKENREMFARRGIDGNLASRFAWYTLINDATFWTEDLWELVDEVWWTSRYAPENMELLFEAIEEQVPPDEAREYIRQIARVGWQNRKPVILRQMAWDVLGYTVTPLILPIQLAGEAYDSYSGRNYEIMRGAAPRLTKYYVDYSCWWFGAMLALSVVQLVAGWSLRRQRMGRNRLSVGRWISAGNGKSGRVHTSRERTRMQIFTWLFGLLSCGILVLALTLRGAGQMDYKWTYGVNLLWVIAALLLMGRMRTFEGEAEEE